MLNQLSALSTVAAMSIASTAYAQTSSYPPEAEPGQCFARILIPETTEIVTEQVVDQPRRTEIKIIPAKYESVTETMIVREETIQYEVAPATYKTVTVTVEIEPERTETRISPAQLESYTEQVLVRPAYTTWKPGAGLFGRNAAGVSPAALSGDQSTGELLCKIEVPAESGGIQNRDAHGYRTT